jgi:hypothetical protein
MELPHDIIRKIGGILVQDLKHELQTPPNQTDAETASCIVNFAASCRVARDCVKDSVLGSVASTNEKILLRRSVAFHTYIDAIDSILNSKKERVLDANITKAGTLLISLHHKGRDFQRLKHELLSTPRFYNAVANARSMPFSIMGPPVAYEGALRDAHKTLKMALRDIGNYIEGDKRERARHTISGGDQENIGDHFTEITRFFRLWHMNKRYKMHSV